MIYKYLLGIATTPTPFAQSLANLISDPAVFVFARSCMTLLAAVGPSVTFSPSFQDCVHLAVLGPPPLHKNQSIRRQFFSSCPPLFSLFILLSSDCLSCSLSRAHSLYHHLFSSSPSTQSPQCLLPTASPSQELSCSP